MTEPRRILFALLHCGLHPDDRERAGSFAPLFGAGTQLPDWPSVYGLAAKQGVLAIAFDGLQRLSDEGVIDDARLPDKTLMLQWAYNVDRIENRYRKQRRAMFRLAEFYAGHNIDMLILKGYGLSLCYPVPEHRPCGDIDIWLFGRQREADELLHSERRVEINEDKHHHTVFVTDGVMVENHYDFLNVHSHVSNRDIEHILQSKVRTEEGSVIAGDAGRVMLPSANFSALFLLRHTAGHFAAENIGLRHIADWAMLVERHGAQIDWPWLEGVAREHNMHRFLYSLNAMAVECAGAAADLFVGVGGDEPLSGRILNEILSPEFAEPKPASGFWRRYMFKLRRWWANRWKRRIVYREGLVETFIVQVCSHILKPGRQSGH